jgi:hypothetical protein
MRYTVPLIYDEAGEPQGLFSVHTSEGKVVILFSNSARWEAFSNPVARVLAGQGQKLASTVIEAPSLEAAVSKLAELDPNVTNEGMFIPDSTPMFWEIVRFFQTQP